MNQRRPSVRVWSHCLESSRRAFMARGGWITRSRAYARAKGETQYLCRNGGVKGAIEEEMIATQEDAVPADVLSTRVADRIAVITLGSPKRIYFDEEMGDALTVALDGYAGDPNIRAVVLTGGAPGYFARHF